MIFSILNELYGSMIDHDASVKKASNQISSFLRRFVIVVHIFVIEPSESTPASNSAYIDVSTHMVFGFRDMFTLSLMLDHCGSLLTIPDHDGS